MEVKIEVIHVSLILTSNFQTFTHNIESLLGRFDQDVFKRLEEDPQSVEEHIKKMAGEEGLMLFDVQDHGKLLQLLVISKRAKQYVIGNPLIAMQMTRHDIRAGLYAPLRVLVYELDENSIQIEYDLPSSLFGQFHNSKVTEITRSLDHKLERLIEKSR